MQTLLQTLKAKYVCMFKFPSLKAGKPRHALNYTCICCWLLKYCKIWKSAFAISQLFWILHWRAWFLTVLLGYMTRYECYLLYSPIPGWARVDYLLNLIYWRTFATPILSVLLNFDKDMGLGKTLQSICIIAGDHLNRMNAYKVLDSILFCRFSHMQVIVLCCLLCFGVAERLKSSSTMLRMSSSSHRCFVA